jgi:hypothetical protein
MGCSHVFVPWCLPLIGVYRKHVGWGRHCLLAKAIPGERNDTTYYYKTELQMSEMIWWVVAAFDVKGMRT